MKRELANSYFKITPRSYKKRSQILKNSKFLPFFNFPAFSYSFPAFFGSLYHNVMNWYEFYLATTAHHGGVKVCIFNGED